MLIHAAPCRCNASGGPPKIVAIDLQPIGAVEGVQLIQGDITDESTAKKVMSIFAGKKADVVVCDGAPDGISIHPISHLLQYLFYQSQVQADLR